MCLVVTDIRPRAKLPVHQVKSKKGHRSATCCPPPAPAICYRNLRPETYYLLPDTCCLLPSHETRVKASSQSLIWKCAGATK